MNTEFALQDFVEEDNFNRVKKVPKNMSFQLEAQLSILYGQVCQMMSEKYSQVKIPEQMLKPIEQLTTLRKIIQFLIQQNLSEIEHKSNNNMNESNIIGCSDCQNYEVNLQKLQNQVRQHIRLQQQLKIYQQSMQQKIQDNKKEKKQIDKKMECQKKQLDEIKNNCYVQNEKMMKLQYENQKLKNEIKSNKNIDMKKYNNKSNAFDGKQNKIDWVHRQISVKKDQKNDRKSIDKSRQQSTQRYRISNNTRSIKGITLNDKLIHEKNKQDRKRVLNSKLQYRR